MLYERDPKEEKRFYTLLREHLKKSDRKLDLKKFHVSDILAPRQWYWRNKNPKEITNDMIGFFLGGIAHHAMAEPILAGKSGEVEHEAVLSTDDGIVIVGHMDVYRKFPIEFKTSRKWTIPKEPAEHYVDQLVCYCALKKANRGKIAVFFLTPGRKWDGKSSTGPELAVWDITFTDEELEYASTMMKTAATYCVSAWEKEDHTLLPLCDDWKCGSKWKGKVKINCLWYEDCKPEGRYPESAIS